MTRLIVPVNGRDLPPAPHVPGTGELHVVSSDGACSFIDAAGVRCTEDHRPAAPSEGGHFGFAEDPNAAGFGEIGNPAVGGRFRS
jgi:hypothetical protein